MSTRSRLPHVLGVALFAYLFFLALDMMGSGMKRSFKDPIKHFLEDNADQFTELASFVIGVLGTALIQSSSSVTSISVEMVQNGVMPLLIAAGIVHGANLGTSVTSSIVAFGSELRRFTGNPLRDLRAMLFEPRGPGFQRAVGTAVVHDFFNIVMITGILLLLELPFELILRSADAVAAMLEQSMQGSAKGIVDNVLVYVTPKTYTRPVTRLIASAVPASAVGWVLVGVGLPLLFASLKGFTSRMRALVMYGVDQSDPVQVGDLLLGTSWLDTFIRGLVVTILVQSSSATTSLVVPLAALGFFDTRKVFPFIMGANIGTTTTALLVATGSVGAPGFEDGMTIALCHVFLNLLAVVLAVGIPGLQSAIVRSADWMGERAAQRPVVLLMYLITLAGLVPAVVYLLPQGVAAVLIGVLVAGLLVAPPLWPWVAARFDFAHERALAVGALVLAANIGASWVPAISRTFVDAPGAMLAVLIGSVLLFVLSGLTRVRPAPAS